MQSSVLVVPGIGNSGPSHWQSRWQLQQPHWSRLEVPNWDEVLCDDWVTALERQLSHLGEHTVVVAHSLGCLAVAHWAARYRRTIRGALLVAVPDPAAPAFPASAAHGFSPLPLARLPFRSTVVASSDDPYGSLTHAKDCAQAWGSDFFNVGALGHLNASSGLDDWRQGYQLLLQMTEQEESTKPLSSSRR